MIRREVVAILQMEQNVRDARALAKERKGQPDGLYAAALLKAQEAALPALARVMPQPTEEEREAWGKLSQAGRRALLDEARGRLGK